MTQHEDYVSYEQAVKLKAAGFDWPTHGYYHKGNCAEDEVWYYTMNPADDHNHRNNPRVWSAPTLAQAQKWLREVHNWHIHIDAEYDRSWFYHLCPIGGALEEGDADFPTYEAALSAGITAALKLVTDKSSKQ